MRKAGWASAKSDDQDQDRDRQRVGREPAAAQARAVAARWRSCRRLPPISRTSCVHRRSRRRRGRRRAGPRPSPRCGRRWSSPPRGPTRRRARPRRARARAQDGIDFGLGADVDAHGRLVEDEDARAQRRAICRAAPSADCRPRAGAPRARRRAAGWRGPRSSGARRRTIAAAVEQHAARKRSSVAMARFSVTVMSEHQAFAMPVLRHEADAARDGLRGGCEADRLAVDLERAAVETVGAEQRRTSSVRLEPMRPVMQKISPA